MNPAQTILTSKLLSIVPKSKESSVLLRFIQKHRLPISNAASLEFKANVSFLIGDHMRNEGCKIIIRDPENPKSISVISSTLLRLAGIPQIFTVSAHQMHLLPNGCLVIVNDNKSPLDVVIWITPEPLL